MPTRIRIDTQLELGDAANLIPITDGGGELNYQELTINLATDVDTTGAANGAILYFNGTNWIDLAIGAAGQVLTVVAGIPAWQNATFTHFTISDGSNTQQIDSTNTVTFTDVTTDSGGSEAAEFNIVVGATDTITFTYIPKDFLYINEFEVGEVVTTGLGDKFFVVPPALNGKYIVSVTMASDTIGGGEDLSADIAINGTEDTDAIVNLSSGTLAATTAITGGILLSTNDIIQINVRDATGTPEGLTTTLLVQ